MKVLKNLSIVLLLLSSVISSSQVAAIPPPPPGLCVEYNLDRCGNLYCIVFKSDYTALCPLCYFVVIKFADGTTTAFSVDFSSGPTLMNCFKKEITSVVSVTPYDCGAQSSSETVSATSTNEAARIIVAPNPVKDFVGFKGENLHGYNVSIYDAAGAELIKGERTDNSIDLRKLKRGLYFYVISNEEGYKQIGRIIKE